jgi:hypothetical protein
MHSWSGLALRASLLVAMLAACDAGASVVGGALPDSGVDAADVAAPPVDTGETADAGVDAPPADAPPVPVAVDTTAPMTVRAGQRLDVTCTLRDADGAVVPTPGGLTPTITFAPADAVQTMGDATVAARVGEVTAACAFPTLALTDPTPARVTITPGDPARVTTTLDRETITAGATVTATCAVTDAFGNAVADAMPTLALAPAGMGATVAGLAATVERAGMYTASCVVPGATGDAAAFAVTPGLPASLSINRTPDMPLYGRGAAVEVHALVSDRYGNVIPAPTLTYASAPEASSMGGAVFTYGREGRYTITVHVTGMTEGDVDLTETTSFVVDSSGPGIDCNGPGHGTMLDAAPGSTVMFRARLVDTSGVRGATINGDAATLDADGNATAPVAVRWGMNFVDVVATDTDGRENSRTCAFLASDRWSPEASPLSDSVALLLRQDAVDDGPPVDPITSINDILRRVVNSQGLRTQLDAGLRAANPLKANSCDQDVCVFGRCVCVFRSEVNYQASEINGPNSTTLTLVDGGLRATARFENVRVRLGIGGTLSTSGWVTVASLDVGLTLDLSLVGGRPHAVVRPGSVSTSVGSISTSFGGITGAIVNVIVRLANGTVRDIVSTQLRNFVTNSFAGAVDGVLGGLDVSSLGASFDVPRLDGAGATPLRFGINISSLSATAPRLLFGLGTLLSTTTPTNARPSLGVALPPGDTGEPALSTPATVAVRVAVLNQALHALWRGAWLDASLDASALSSMLPAGSTLQVTGLLPPVASLRADGRVNLDLGGLEVAFVIPGAGDPFLVSVGARASGAVTLMGDSLRFGSVTLDETHVSVASESISMADREALGVAVTALLQTYVTRSLNDALPTIPIPSFAVPASLATYGLPAGAQLGIRGPALTQARQRFELRGGFGQR